ncbi:unnamed protein product, partial [Mesorhabditis belari]|uniref:non-specific serine/threonine protein kinase n=1 Tax=Mesorhabditis belari TaxID=2138241 RepID=A0AAF3EHW2_9BILA
MEILVNEAPEQDLSDNSSSNMATTETLKFNHRLLPRIRRYTEKGKLLAINSHFLKRYNIKGLLGMGGYGEIYFAKDTITKTDVAIKVEPKMRRNRVAKRMMLEQRVLCELKGKPHAPYIIGSGHIEKINYIILQLLSVNLSDLKRASPQQRLSRHTVGRVLVQGIAALREIHKAGYVHRDVKPGNMCFGVTPQSQHRLVLLDFGLVRRYLHEDGTLRPSRKNCGFRGTVRYVSLRVHHHQEQAPCDDLVSMMYTGLELLISNLPWKNKSQSREIRRAKEELFTLNFLGFAKIIGEPFMNFARMVNSLQGDDVPDYDVLQKCLLDMYRPRGLLDPIKSELPERRHRHPPPAVSSGPAVDVSSHSAFHRLLFSAHLKTLILL